MKCSWKSGAGTSGEDRKNAPADAKFEVSCPVRLLRHLMPSVRFTWMLASVRSARVGEGFSPELEAALPRLRGRLMELAAAR